MAAKEIYVQDLCANVTAGQNEKHIFLENKNSKWEFNMRRAKGKTGSKRRHTGSDLKKKKRVEKREGGNQKNDDVTEGGK